MMHVCTAWKRLAQAVLAAVPALPLCASIPRVSAESDAWDALGRLLAATNAAGEQVVRNFYDAVGHQKSAKPEASPMGDRDFEAVLPHGARSGVPRHSGNCTLLGARNNLSTNAFAYDAMDRLTSSVIRVSGQAFAMRCGYDLGGLRTNVVYPDGRAVRYGYDADGRVASVTDWAGRTWTFTRDAAGRLTALSCPNGVSGSWAYDANHAVASWSWSAGGSPFAGREIARDAAGIKTEEHVSAGLFPNPQDPRRAVNAFDAADRLVSATVVGETNTVAETYLHDLNGAVTNIVSGTESVFRAAYDALGQVSVVGGQACGYDATGNRIVAGGRIWVPDHADPLKRPLVEADTNGVAVRYYIWGDGRLLGFVNAADGSLTVAHCDEQGSVIALTDASGSVLHRACYGPYGEDWGHSGTNSVPFRWLGSHGVVAVGYLSPLTSSLLPHTSSLYLTRHRLYSATLCRFLSPDPSGLGGGPNLYAYCLGNPLAYIDPQGLAISAAASGFGEGLGGGLSVLANTFTFGGTDALGWTTSSAYQGSEYDFSRYAATVSRESLITAATLGIGAAAQGGSLSAQIAHSGIQAVELTTGSYQFGTGLGEVISGNYGNGTLAMVSGGLRVGGVGANHLLAGQLGAPAGTARVTSWASAGSVPDLSVGRWVQLGGATPNNFLKTGLPANVPFSNSITDFVPASALQWPSGWEWIKGFLGQRILSK